MCRTLWPNMHFLQKRKCTTQTASALIGPSNHGALQPTYFCFISRECGVNPDGVTGTTAKMFANLRSEPGLKRKEVGKREERTRLRLPAEEKGSMKMEISCILPVWRGGRVITEQ